MIGLAIYGCVRDDQLKRRLELSAGRGPTACSLRHNSQDSAENLHRAELTALERDEQIARWIVLSDEKEKKLAQAAPEKGGRGKRGGVRAASRKLGIDRDDARRAKKVAGLSDEAKAAAREAGLDDNACLDVAATGWFNTSEGPQVLQPGG